MTHCIAPHTMYPQIKYINWIRQKAHASLTKSWESCEKDCAENERGAKYTLSSTGQNRDMEDKDI